MDYINRDTVSEVNDVENGLLQSFGIINSFFSGVDIEKSAIISKEKIILALKKIQDKDNSQLWSIFKEKIKNENFINNKFNNISILSGKVAQIAEYKIAYRTYRATKRNEAPFYSISGSRIKKLEDMGVDVEVLIFWEKQEKGSFAQTYINIVRLDEIDRIWSKQTNSDLYRISFLKKERNDAYEYESANGQKLIRCKTGTAMANDAE